MKGKMFVEILITRAATIIIKTEDMKLYIIESVLYFNSIENRLELQLDHG